MRIAVAMYCPLCRQLHGGRCIPAALAEALLEYGWMERSHQGVYIDRTPCRVCSAAARRGDDRPAGEDMPVEFYRALAR